MLGPETQRALRLELGPGESRPWGLGWSPPQTYSAAPHCTPWVQPELMPRRGSLVKLQVSGLEVSPRIQANDKKSSHGTAVHRTLSFLPLSTPLCLSAGHQATVGVGAVASAPLCHAPMSLPPTEVTFRTPQAGTLHVGAHAEPSAWWLRSEQAGHCS